MTPSFPIVKAAGRTDDVADDTAPPDHASKSAGALFSNGDRKNLNDWLSKSGDANRSTRLPHPLQNLAAFCAKY